MRHNVKLFVQTVSDIFETLEPMLEIGSLQVPGQEGFADLRPLFEGKTYLGCDMTAGPGVNVLGDVEKLGIANESVGTVLIADTLEHVERPWGALEETHRVLKRNGLVVITSVMNFNIHEYPRDYWRFTPQAFSFLLNQFPSKIIGSQGLPLNPHTVFGIGFKGKSPVLTKFEELCHGFSGELSKTMTRPTLKLRIFQSIIQKRFPYLLDPKHSRAFRTVYFEYLKDGKSIESFTKQL